MTASSSCFTLEVSVSESHDLSLTRVRGTRVWCSPTPGNFNNLSLEYSRDPPQKSQRAAGSRALQGQTNKTKERPKRTALRFWVLYKAAFEFSGSFVGTVQREEKLGFIRSLGPCVTCVTSPPCPRGRCEGQEYVNWSLR